MKKTIFLISLFLISLCFGQSRYIGVGFQKDILESWNLEIIKINNNEYSVKYPSIPCTSKWTLIKQEDNFLIYKEELTSGFDECKNFGIIFLIDDSSSSTTKRFYIFNKIEDKKPYAYGFLELIE